MNARCPYRHLSYSSWRLRTLCGLIQARSAEVLSTSTSRSFSTSSDLLGSPGNPNRRGRRRRGTKPARNQDLALLRYLHAEVSNVIQIGSGISQTAVASGTPESDNTQDTPTAPTPNQPSQSLTESFLVPRLGTRERRRKPQPTQDDKDRLKNNPWAQALASPVRMCSATGVRIPSDLLLGYGLVQHPTTQNVWIMPTELLQDELRRSMTTASSLRKRFPNFRMSNGFQLLSAVNKMKRKSLMNKVIPYLWKAAFGGKLTRVDEQNAVWRKDMPTYVLRNMRSEVVKVLKKGARLEKNPEIESDAWSVLSVKDVGTSGLQDALRKVEGLERVRWGGVLILKTKGNDYEIPAGEQSSNEASNSVEAVPSTVASGVTPPDFVPLPSNGTQVPVFDLTKLLSEEHLEELRGGMKLFQETAIFFRPGGHFPADLMLWLWRLRCYHAL